MFYGLICIGCFTCVVSGQNLRSHWTFSCDNPGGFSERLTATRDYKLCKDRHELFCKVSNALQVVLLIVY